MPATRPCTLEEVSNILRNGALTYTTDRPNALPRSLGFSRKNRGPFFERVSELVELKQVRRQKKPMSPKQFYQRKGKQFETFVVTLSWVE